MKLFPTAAVMFGLLASILSASAQTGTGSSDAATLAEYEKSYNSAKLALKKKPAEPKIKANFVIATDRLAMATMNSLSLGPKAKYPKSLRLFREVLKVDPKDRAATHYSELIVSIYKQMGRPVPKD